MRSPQLHPLLPHAIPTPLPRLPRPSEKSEEADPFHFRRTSLSRQEVGEAGARAGEKKNNTKTDEPRMRCSLAASGVESGCRIRRSARSAPARSQGFLHTAPPPFQSPLPLPLSPAGALSPAPGPCSPAPAPVGFVSTGRRHPGCVPLDGTLGYLLEEAGGGRDSGVAGGFVCGGGDRSSVPVARNLAVPAPWGPAATAPVSAPAPPARHPL